MKLKKRDKKNCSPKVQAMLNDALQSMKAHKYEEALKIFLILHKTRPNDLFILNALAVSQGFCNQTDMAVKNLNQAIKLDPKYTDSYCNLGLIYFKENNIIKAKEYYKKCLTIDPTHAMALNNLASIELEHNNIVEAYNLIEKSLTKSKDDPILLFNYAKLLTFFNRYSEANNIYIQLLDNNYRNQQILAEYANLLFLSKNIKEAKIILEEILKNNPEFFAANSFYSDICFYEGRHSDYYKYAKKALKSKPDDIFIISRLSLSAIYLGLYNEFESLRLKALTFFTEGLHFKKKLIAPFSSQRLTSDLKLQKDIAISWADSTNCSFNKTMKTLKYKHEKLHIGFISSDFGEHPVGLLVQDLFQEFNKNRLKLFGFSTMYHKCERYNHIAKQFDEFYLIENLPPNESAKHINDCEIDILVDLVGATQNSNYEILQQQPAPIQCHTIGYTGTMGAEYIKYFLTTENTTPPNLHKYFVEKLVYLPQEVGMAPLSVNNKNITRNEFELPDDKFVFLAHHSGYRVDLDSLELWFSILQKQKNAVLWMLVHNKQQKQAVINIGKRFSVSQQRIIFYDSNLQTKNWQLRLADLALDTVNFSSGTMTLIAAQANLPLLSYCGSTPQSRVASSILKDLNMNELVALNKEDYFYLACELSSNNELLTKIKTKLQSQIKKSKTFNTKNYAKSLEQAFIKMYQDFWNNQNNNIIRI
jgi:protein O-GlcNAc transferase